MTDVYIEPEGAEFFCEDCAPAGSARWPDGGGEADTPQHCGGCDFPLNNPLTPEGVRYVLEAVDDAIASQHADSEYYSKACGTAYVGGWFEGARHCEIVRGWAEQVRCYNLSADDAEKVEKFLEASREKPHPEREGG